MPNQDLKNIKRSSTIGIISLSIRNLLIQSISAVGYFLLSYFMGVAEAGLFDITNEIVSIFGYFSDLGFVAALIQKKSKPKKRQLQTAFSFQQVVVFISLLIVFFKFPSIRRNRGYGPKETWLLASLCFSFFTSSLRTIPSVLLERNLKFKTISVIAIVENLIYYSLAVSLAYLGFGSYSYAIAIFVRSIFSLIAYYSVSPWPIGINFSLKSAKKLFSFGIPYQANSIIAMIKDRFSNVFVAGIIGRLNYGLLGWGQKIPRYSLSLMDAVMKVTFPALSRLQSDKELVKKYLQKSIYFISLLSFPLLAGSALVSPNIIHLIPKYTKWLAAIPSLYVFSLTYAISSITTPLTNAFNATGKITITTRLMIMWTALTWLLLPPLSIYMGLTGALIANLLINISSFYVWHLAGKNFGLSIVKTIFTPLVSVLTMILAVLLIDTIYTPSKLIYLIILKIVIGAFIYITSQLLMSKKQILWYVDQIKDLKNK